MTNKTDIAALVRPVRDRYDWKNVIYRECDHCATGHTGTVAAEDGSSICASCADQIYWSAWQELAERALTELEAANQRADDEKSLNKHLALAIRQSEGVSANLRRLVVRAESENEAANQRADKAERANRNQYRDLIAGHEAQRVLQAELAALKGDQVPVTMDALRDAVAEMTGGLPMLWQEGSNKGHQVVPFINFNSLHRIVTKFTAPQKPVEDYFSSLVARGKSAAEKAVGKYPQPNYVLLKVAEEAGEVVRAGVHYAEGRMPWEELEGEVIQLIAMLNRLMVEGDQVNGVNPPQAKPGVSNA